ncbi:MAG: hypothetical protein JWN57_1764 [Frankiales bacterium]|nr:hypothetical protein [Frankiales bacterium]
MPFWKRAQLSAEDDFAGSLRVACDRIGLTVQSYDGETVDVRGRRLNGKIGLDDLRAQCALLPRAAWTDVLTEALQGLARGREASADLADPDVAGPLLRTRVQAEGAVLVDDVVHAPLCPGLVETLAVVLDGALAPVSTTLARGWGVPLPDLLERGRRQAMADGPPTVGPVDLGGPEVVAVQTESAFAATHLHHLADLLEVPAAGALLALPTRHLLLAAPLLRRDDTLHAAQALLVNAERLWRDGPGGLSPDLFWWTGGRLVPLPGTPTSLSPPVAFVEVLDRLPG